MTDFWQNLLKHHTIDQFAAFEDTNYLMPLAQLSVLQVTGDDASSFLQNLLTNDVNALAINESQLSGFCNAKGRLFANFLLIRRSDGFLLVLPKNMCATLLQRLSMFKLRSKVAITDLSESQLTLGLSQCSNKLSSRVKLPENTFQLTESNNNLIIKLPSHVERYLIIGQAENLTELCTELSPESWHVTNESVWKLLNIKTGLPDITPETKEKFTPQQINFDLIGGVSFSKGCYPGQEVVARLHYLGKPSRRLFSAEYIGKVLAEAGQEITDQDGNVLGHVVNAEFSSENNAKLLISLKLAEIDKSMFINASTRIENIVGLAEE